MDWLLCLYSAVILFLVIVLTTTATQWDRLKEAVVRPWRTCDRGGVRHDWLYIRDAGGMHDCKWAYCHCKVFTCTRCPETKLVSEGVEEYR